MSIGPICGAGGLAIMIPPSSLGVILGSLAYIPIGKLLIGGIVPGLLMAVLFAAYIVIRCTLNPAMAPSYECKTVPLSEKVMNTVKYVLPLGLVIFAVIGTMLIGIATPTEAAALGAFGSIILGIAYRGFTRVNLKKALLGTFRVSVMVLMIIGTASGFSQLMGFTGTAKNLVEFTLGLDVSPFMILIMINIIVVIMGCLMEQTSILIISIPLFMPIIKALGFDPLWFGVLMLINMEIAGNSPPFGLILFVVKGVSPADTSMMDVYKAALPFVFIELLVLAIGIMAPSMVLWLPGLMTAG
jgi:tripartite ATP-independent transporter DctM subunit